MTINRTMSRFLASLLTLLCCGLAFADSGMGPGPGGFAVVGKHVVQSNTTYFSSSPVNIYFTTQNTTAGNAIIAIVSLYNNTGGSNAVSATDVTTSAAFNSDIALTGTGGASTVFVGSYFNIVGGTEDHIQISVTNNITIGGVAILEVSGLQTNGQDIEQTASSASSTAVTIGPYTPAQASELYISVLSSVSCNGLTNIFPLSGYTEIFGNSGTGCWDMSYEINTSGTSAITNNYGTLSISSKWALGMVTYK